ncbi:hypothetical protein [Helicobacter sp.]|uniref:hypothetical protein n=1 Tax=Helicobacter sp. TaxID=218 RepID=UPI0019BC3608|nr:hypothetical protein [Helicobacter sp.]MBD5164521.1 hypothetical protein [Helicobacter sp.]
MQKEDWILFLVFLIGGLLLIALFFVFLGDKFNKKETTSDTLKIPNAQEILELLKDKKNDLKQLEQYSKLAFAHYQQYMQEIESFDLEFITILTSHKGVSAKLILEVERHFKQLNPARKELLEKALGMGLKHR